MQKTAWCGGSVRGSHRHFIKTLLVLLTALFLNAHATGFAQNISFSGKEVPLKKILAEVKKQTGYAVSYTDNIWAGTTTVTIQAVNVPLRDFLNRILSGQPVTYFVEYKTIFLYRKDKKTAGQSQQVMNTSGAMVTPLPLVVRVQDSLGRPLSGASISLQNRKLSGVADAEGILSLNAVEGDVILVSFIGYATRYILVTQSILSEPVVVVSMITSVSKLEALDIVVNTGYQTLSKERATGSFSKPDMKVFSARSSTMDLVGRLEGQIPGLVVGQEFNTDYNTHARTQKSIIRGAGSISLPTEPLYVLNGVVVADYSLVNVDDIEDITVLKDAAAAAIWGAKAANGVIVIKTKSGRKNQKVRFAYNGFTEVKGRPDMNYQRLLNSQQFIQAARETFDPVNNPYSALTFDQVAPHEQILYDQQAGLITAAQANASLDSLGAIDNNAQIKNLLFRKTVTTNHNISASGGSETYNFYSSLGYNGVRGGSPGSSANTYRFSLDQTFTPNDRLTIVLNTQLSSINTRDANSFNYSPTMVPYQQFKDANGSNLSMPYLVSYYSREQRQLYQDMSGVDLQTYIPLDELNYGYTKMNALLANLVGDIGVKLWKGISLKGTYGYSTSPRNTDGYLDHQMYSQRDMSIDFIPVDGSQPYMPLTGGTLSTSNSNQKNWTVRNQLLYEYSGRNGNDLVNLQAGQEANESINSGTVATVLGWDNQLQTAPYIDYQLLRGGVFNTVTGSGFLGITPYTAAEFRTRFNSYFALASYRLNRKYSIDGSWRVDHSNLFGSDVSAQNKPVYSVGGKWQLNNEKFMEHLLWIDKLALRTTYGITGNSPYTGASTAATVHNVIGPEQYLSYPQIGGPSYTLRSPANDKLVWESSKTWNFGLDFSVLNNRLSGSIEYYTRNTSNLLGSLPTDLFTGIGSITTNVGNLDNSGINVNISSVNVQTRNFAWNTSVIFSFNRNKLTTYTPPESYENEDYFRAIANYVVGYPLLPVFAYKYAGLDKNGDPQIQLANGHISKDPQDPTAGDLVYMGSAVPKFNGGISNTFTYKLFSLSVNMIYNLGAVMRRDVNNFYTGRLSTTNVPLEFMNRWKKPGDENTTNIPSYTPDVLYNYTARNTNYYTQSDINVISASYLKMRDATLSYSLPAAAVNWLKIQSASLRVQVNNVMLWRNNAYGIDPEYYGFRNGYRAVRIGEHAIAIGANINF